MTLLDQEIAHITRAVRFSLCRPAGDTVFPAAYWRRRLNQLLTSVHLTKAQLAAIDSLLCELNTYEAQKPECRGSGRATGSR